MATTRPRGFINTWSPQRDTLELVSNVQAILREYSDITPLTLRQIFYMLVSGYGFDKTEKAYKRLCETMNRARRAKLIDMDDIRDDGLRRQTPHGWECEASILATFRSYGRRFRLNRQQNQPVHLMVWCEAGGMLPQLAKYCEDYGVPVLSSGGFDSVTTKHNFAREACDYDAVEILHIGDHDPSGVHMCSSLDEDLSAFVDHYGGDITVTRLAVTPSQIRRMDLPKAPAKRTDNRSFKGLTTQAEAIPPRKLREIVQDALSDRIDAAIYQETLAEEEAIRASLTEKLASL
ncbi:hypothetical protein [Pacificoceanicola onchidii]|uniref:hypothetical protein n=1 Tax=Pacificoceanicola onchidii TaxID=2562685 RepID=UPI0010A44F48|nr:hypothetical protein [Pacificoceanicola onchidii]